MNSIRLPLANKAFIIEQILQFVYLSESKSSSTWSLYLFFAPKT